MNVSEVMSTKAVTVTPQQNLQEAAEIMKRLGIGFLPVGENDRLVGTITDRDIAIRGIAEGLAGNTPIDVAMTRDLFYCFQDQDVAEVARNMGEMQVRRMAVTDRNKQLVGIVSLGDLSSDGDPSAAGVALESISS